MQDFYVYMLKCADNSYYIGHTDNLEQRIAEHKNGGYSAYTTTRLPVIVVFVQAFASRDEAFNMERKIKGWSRKKKEALIKGDWDEIIRLSNLKRNEKK
jgi:predicted GIY-YIG superfamily endonuclease